MVNAKDEERNHFPSVFLPLCLSIIFDRAKNKKKKEISTQFIGEYTRLQTKSTITNAQIFYFQ